jgi:hypothetical protein
MGGSYQSQRLNPCSKIQKQKTIQTEPIPSKCQRLSEGIASKQANLKESGEWAGSIDQPAKVEGEIANAKKNGPLNLLVNLHLYGYAHKNAANDTKSDDRPALFAYKHFTLGKRSVQRFRYSETILGLCPLPPPPPKIAHRSRSSPSSSF